MMIGMFLLILTLALYSPLCLSSFGLGCQESILIYVSDRHRVEKLSNLVKTFKHSLQTYTSTAATGISHPFSEFTIAAPRFNLVLSRLTHNTYVLVVLPPGEMDMAIVRHNICVARESMGRGNFGAAVGGGVVGGAEGG